MLRRRARTNAILGLDRFGRSPAFVRPARVGQAFEGTITAEVRWESHEQIDAWLRDRLFALTRQCSDEEAAVLAQSRSDNRACWGLVDPVLIGTCWVNNGTRYRNAVAQIQANCEQLKAQARAYAADAHAKLDARLAAEAAAREAERVRRIRDAARTPVSDARVVLRPGPFVPATPTVRGGGLFQ